MGIVLSASRPDGTMRILLFSCLLLATLGLSSGGILKKLKKLLKDEEECDVVWEEHYQPHCTTRYEKHCEHKYLDKCHTEYTTECKEGHERQCKTEYDTQCKTEYAKQCSNEYHEKCEPVYKKQCHGGGKKKGKKFKRDVAKELVHSEDDFDDDDDEDLEDIKKMST